jgi:reactive intermediate/imine deaminase
MKKVIQSAHAPKAIGPYSQAIQAGDFVFISGQIPLSPETGQLCSSEIAMQAHQVLKNLQAICLEAGGCLQDIVKLTIYLIDLSHFETVNHIMQEYFQAPYPARVTLGVASLPRQSLIEIEAIMAHGVSLSV